MKDYSLRDEKSKLIQALATSLHEHITELFDNGYDQGYEDGKKENCDCKDNMESEYNRGLNDAWEAAKNIHDGQIPYEVFGLDKTGNGFTYASPLNWGETITVQEVISKIKEYEEQQKQDAEIKVGDEVVLNGNASYENEIGIILAYDGQSYPYHVLMSNGDSKWVRKDAIERKTGRHFDQIAEVLAEMRGEE